MEIPLQVNHKICRCLAKNNENDWEMFICRMLTVKLNKLPKTRNANLANQIGVRNKQRVCVSTIRDATCRILSNWNPNQTKKILNAHDDIIKV